MSISSNKILVTGGNGQLASALKKINENVILCDKYELDITIKHSIEKVISKYQPDLIVNAAAYTAVDKAETNQKQAMLVNHEGASNIGMACKARNIPLIHISTDYVFDGSSSDSMSETDQTNPLNVYGQSKLLGEEAISKNCDNYIILRVSGIFSEFGHNFLKTMLHLAQTKNTLSVVNDQFICPTYAGDIAKAIITIASKFSTTGIYHFSSTPVTSWYNFANAIFSESSKHIDLKVKNVNPIAAKDYPTAAKRPAYSILNCHKIFMDYGVTQPGWETAVKSVIPELLVRSTT